MLVLAGILDFGFLLYSRMTVINAAREGARAAVMVANYSEITSVAQAAATASAAGGGLTVSGVTTTCYVQSSTTVVPCGGASTGDVASVTVSYTYHTFFPLLFGTSFNLSSTVEMVIE